MVGFFYARMASLRLKLTLEENGKFWYNTLIHEEKYTNIHRGV